MTKNRQWLGIPIAIIVFGAFILFGPSMVWSADDCGCMYLEPGTAEVWVNMPSQAVGVLAIYNGSLHPVEALKSTSRYCYFVVPDACTVSIVVWNESAVSSTVEILRWASPLGNGSTLQIEPGYFMFWFTVYASAVYDLRFSFVG